MSCYYCQTANAQRRRKALIAIFWFGIVPGAIFYMLGRVMAGAF